MTEPTEPAEQTDRLRVRIGRNPYLRATMVVGAALLVRLVFFKWLGTAVPLLTFLAAVVVAARWGGLGPGLYATALSAVAAVYFLLPPIFNFSVETQVQRFALGIFCVIGATISWASESLRRAERSEHRLAMLANERAEHERRSSEGLVATQHELIEERQRVSNLISDVPGVVWQIWGDPGDLAAVRTDFVSGYVFRLLGYRPDEFIDHPDLWLHILHPDDRERVAHEASSTLWAMFASPTASCGPTHSKTPCKLLTQLSPLLRRMHVRTQFGPLHCSASNALWKKHKTPSTRDGWTATTSSFLPSPLGFSTPTMKFKKRSRMITRCATEAPHDEYVQDTLFMLAIKEPTRLKRHLPTDFTSHDPSEWRTMSNVLSAVDAPVAATAAMKRSLERNPTDRRTLGVLWGMPKRAAFRPAAFTLTLAAIGTLIITSMAVWSNARGLFITVDALLAVLLFFGLGPIAFARKVQRRNPFVPDASRPWMWVRTLAFLGVFLLMTLVSNSEYTVGLAIAVATFVIAGVAPTASSAGE